MPTFVEPETSGSENAETAKKLATPRNIGGVSFDGSVNIDLPGVNSPGNQNTTGSAATLTNARTIGGVSFDGSANISLPGVDTAGNQNTTGSAATLTTPRNINGVSFNGSGDITVTADASTLSNTVPIAKGGTGATSASTAATALGVGTTNDVQFDSFGVGTQASGTTGEIRATNDITAYYSSDKRLKTNIKPIQNPLSKLQHVGGYTFDWIPKDGIHSHEGCDIGVIAQEIEEVLPELTTTRDNGYKAVKYEKLTAFLLECMKEQQQQINSLSEKIKSLEKNNE